MDSATATCTTWRVTINPKYWDLERFQRDWTPGTIIPQAKGANRMIRVPARNDLVYFVSLGKIVMRGTVLSDGFQAGTDHRTDPYNLLAGPHRDVAEFAKVRVDEVGLSIPCRPGGHQTWTRFTDPPTSSALSVTEIPVEIPVEIPAEAATGGAGTETPTSPVPLSKAELRRQLTAIWADERKTKAAKAEAKAAAVKAKAELKSEKERAKIAKAEARAAKEAEKAAKAEARAAKAAAKV